MMNKLNNKPFKAKLAKGFTLIELMIAVAIVGILAAISVPAYSDYMNRSKVSEVMAVLNACKVSVAEFVVSNSNLPANAAQAGCDTTPNTTYAGNLTYRGTDGTISVVIQNVHPEINGLLLRLRPSSTPGTYTALPPGTTDIAYWQCGATGAMSAPGRRFLAANCRGNAF
ncbi:MAG: pilin [Limnobacter sp.]|nr:pilin [Limnobacter sp.]